MDPLATEIIVLVIVIILAGFLAAAEVAVGSFGSGKIEELKDKNDKKVHAFEYIQGDPDSFFGTIQLTTTALIALAAFIILDISIQIFDPIFINWTIPAPFQQFHVLSIFIALVLASSVIIIFCILIPKALGFKYAEGIARGSVRWLIVLTTIFKYPAKLVSQISNWLLTPFKERTNFFRTRFSEDEIRIIISEGVKSGALDETEHEIIENIFEFNDLRANEVMIPRTDMFALELLDDSSSILKGILKTTHSLIPVYKDSIDNIVGVLHAKDLMKSYIENSNINLRGLIRPAYFIPETKLISEILKEMQKRGERLAIVTDEYGGTEGVITMEDILEEIVGEFGDTSKSELSDFSKLPDGKYYILGSMSIDDFNDIFNIELPESDEYNTLAGFIADASGKILNTGETVEYNGLTIELIKKIRQKMVQFKVYSSSLDFKEKEEN